MHFKLIQNYFQNFCNEFMHLSYYNVFNIKIRIFYNTNLSDYNLPKKLKTN